MKIAIWDIDNCLADDHHRLHLIDWHLQGDERYARYNLLMALDAVAHREKFHEVSAEASPVFFTGRPEHHRATTVAWLAHTLGVRDPLLFMRPTGTLGLRAWDLKESMLEELVDVYVGDIRNIVAAFDDLPAVVDMYRRHGIQATVLQIGDPKLAYDATDLSVGAAA